MKLNNESNQTPNAGLILILSAHDGKLESGVSVVHVYGSFLLAMNEI